MEGKFLDIEVYKCRTPKLFDSVVTHEGRQWFEWTSNQKDVGSEMALHEYHAGKSNSIDNLIRRLQDSFRAYLISKEIKISITTIPNVVLNDERHPMGVKVWQGKFPLTDDEMSQILIGMRNFTGVNSQTASQGR